MLERVIEIIQEQLNLDGVEITEESSFKDDLGADSLDLFELVMAFEEAHHWNIQAKFYNEKFPLVYKSDNMRDSLL